MYGKAAELLMEPPHIWIFSNELPNISMCSLDRWHVWHLYDVPKLEQFDDDDPVDSGVKFEKLSVSEVVEMVAAQRAAEMEQRKKHGKEKDD